MGKRLVVISDCTRECPFIEKVHTPGSVFGEDYLCTKAKKVNGKFRTVAGYIEWQSELPKKGTFPRWCPLQEAEEGMYLEGAKK